MVTLSAHFSGKKLLKLCQNSKSFPGQRFLGHNVFLVRSKLVSFSELRVRRAVGGQQKETPGGLRKQKEDESSQIKTYLYLVKMYLVSKNRGREDESSKT